MGAAATASDQLADLLRRKGALELPRGVDLFIDHLRGLSAILRDWGCAPWLCDAGLFHSVYGTAGFDEAVCSFDDRDEIRASIGPDAERVVFLFCRITADSLLRSVLQRGSYALVDRFDGARHAVTAETLGHLLCIELADILDNHHRYRRRPATIPWRAWVVRHHLLNVGRGLYARALAAGATRLVAPHILSDFHARLSQRQP
ncbi:DUF6817 domain-containing protein [Sorangium sp. So ce1182]|uniref:DUF6817 domain-containing protein n=1 Tax=Sorangium sp. So ce1182 TaxID=3133334 RepID=UPI003F5EB5CA